MHAISQIFSNAFFFQSKCMNFASDFTQICSQGSNQQNSSSGSDNGLVPIRRQAIIWTNYGLVYWRIYASLGLNELKTIRSQIWYRKWLKVYWEEIPRLNWYWMYECGEVGLFPLIWNSTFGHGKLRGWGTYIMWICSRQSITTNYGFCL